MSVAMDTASRRRSNQQVDNGRLLAAGAGTDMRKENTTSARDTSEI